MITTRSKGLEEVLERSEWTRKRNRNKFVPPILTVQEINIKTEEQRESYANWNIIKKASDKMIGEKEAVEVCKNWDLIRNVGSTESRDFSTQEYYSHKRLCTKYPNRTWENNRCFIIGGGPSLKGFDFSQLDGELTIAVNRAFEKLDPSILFFMDNETFYKPVLKGKFGKKATAKFVSPRTMKIALNIGGAKFDHGTYSIPLSKKPEITLDLKNGLFEGGNSGFAALNLAICLRANPIYLLGFDMNPTEDGKQAWFHDGYESVGKDTVYKKWIKHFVEAAPLIKQLGIKVINLNPKSELTCFEFGEFRKLDPKPGYDYHAAYDSKKVIPHKNKTAYFEGALGIGDNFYQRPLIKELVKTYKKVYLRTAFPEIYWDIPNVEFVYPNPLNLRTQKKHVKSLPKKTWSDRPKNADTIPWASVGPTAITPPYNRIKTKYVELEDREDFDFTFPVKNEWVKAAKKLVESLPIGNKKLCIVRRPTDRKEWNCPARNPKIEYYQLLIDKYKKEYFFLGLADIKEKEEWFAGEITGLDKQYNKGEIPLTTIFGLLKIADMTITYPSLFMIAAIAIRAKCFCIFGGIAGPEAILRRNFGFQNFAYVAADPFCTCHVMEHDCNKDIPTKKILDTFNELKQRKKVIKRISVGLPPGFGDSYWVLVKLESFKEKNAIDHLTVIVHRDSIHYYTFDYLRLVPFIDEVRPIAETVEIGQFYDKENPTCISENGQGFDYTITPGAMMYLKGIHLEDIMPEYDINYKIPINLSFASKEFATALKEKNNEKMVLFYTSSIGNNGVWNNNDWKYKDWMKLMELIHDYSGIRPIAIGAGWDRDYLEEIKKLDKGNIIQDFVGGIDIQLTLSLLKKTNLLIAFASGIPIFATYFGIPTVMFYAIKGVSTCDRFDPSFKYVWTPPGTRKLNKYMPVDYKGKETTPERIFERVKEFL